MKQRPAGNTEKSFSWSWGLSNGDPQGYRRLQDITAKNQSVLAVFDALILTAGPNCPAGMDVVEGDYPKGIPIRVSIKKLVVAMEEVGLSRDDFAACVSLLEAEGIMQDVKGLAACCASFSEKK